jgi:hypothetical protein
MDVGLNQYQEYFWGDKGSLTLKADNLTALYEILSRQNVGASTPYNLMGLHGLLQGYLYLFTFYLFFEYATM